MTAPPRGIDPDLHLRAVKQALAEFAAGRGDQIRLDQVLGRWRDLVQQAHPQAGYAAKVGALHAAAARLCAELGRKFPVEVLV